MSEMFIFSANGRAGKDNSFGYSAGEKHALLLILRQPSDSEPDWLAAEVAASASGWYDLEFKKASTIPAGNLAGQPSEVVACYQHAVDHGSSLIAFRDALD